MARVPLPLFVLPGIGADDRFLDAQRTIRDIRPITWIAPAHPRETLGQYAQRLASELCISEPFDLGGSSFGGMIALELARYLAPQRVFLFGSCRSPRSIAPLLRALRFFAPVLPDRLLRPPRVLQPLVARWFGARSHAHVQLFADMLAVPPIEFIRWASIAIFSWEGVEELPMPIHHVHGDRDRLIPVRGVHPDRVIAGAGHLLNITHPSAVNDFIADVDRHRVASASD
jgi:pimeloyl-ACP methyl ester carboxylesterase